MGTQLDSIERKLDRIEEEKLKEIWVEIQHIKERLAGGFITVSDCDKCKESTRRDRESLLSNAFKTIPILISVVALLMVYFK